MYNTAEDMQAELKKTPANNDLARVLHTPNTTISATLLCIVGVNNHERSTPQSITALLNIEKSSRKITDFDIKNIQNLLENFTQEKPFLIERMCYLMACELFMSFETLMAISLTIEKPEALRHAQKVYATIRMERLTSGAG